MSSIQEKDKKYVANTYNRFPVEIVSGKGSEVYDTDGKPMMVITISQDVTQTKEKEKDFKYEKNTNSGQLEDEHDSCTDQGVHHRACSHG